MFQREENNLLGNKTRDESFYFLNLFLLLIYKVVYIHNYLRLIHTFAYINPQCSKEKKK